MHESGSPPRQSSGDKGDARESQGRVHERPVLAEVLQILCVRRGFHMSRSLVLTTLRLLAEVDQDNGQETQERSHSEGIPPVAESLGGLGTDHVTRKGRGMIRINEMPFPVIAARPLTLIPIPRVWQSKSTPTSLIACCA